MRFIGLCLIIFISLLASNCSNEVAGGTTSTENGKVLGIVKNENDSMVSNCEVMLVPSDYNPLIDTTVDYYIDTTNSFGEYLFDPVKSNNYNLICRDSNMSILVNISVNGDSIHVVDQILKPSSTLKVKISGDMPFMNYAYFQGTPFVATFDSTDSSFFFPNLPYGNMPGLIFENDSNDIVVQEGVVISDGQDQNIEVDTNSFIIDNRIIADGVVSSISSSPFKKWAGVVDNGLYYSNNGSSGWFKTDTGASPWLQDSILKIEANEYLDNDWALVKTNNGTLFYNAGTYWSVEEQLYVPVEGKLPVSMLISDNEELILSYDDITIIGTQTTVGDTLNEFEWSTIPSGIYEYIAGVSDSLYLVKNGTEIYRRFGTEFPYLYYSMKDSITGLSMIDDYLYIGTSTGFYRYDFNIDSLFILSIELNTDNVRSILKNGNGEICTLVGDRSVLFYDGVDDLIYTPKIDTTAEFIDMTFQNRNQLWISAGGKGIYTLQPVE